MREELKANIKNIWTYIEANIENNVKFIIKVPVRLQPAARSIALKLVRKVLLANHD
jgi:hypothetical protein